MVLTRSQTKRLQNEAVRGVVIGFLEDKKPVLIGIEAQRIDCKEYKYLNGKFYTAHQFKVMNIEPYEYSNKKMKYSQATVQYTGLVQYGDNMTKKPLLFYDRIDRAY